MTIPKKFRLWLAANGKPLYVEVLDGELTKDGIERVHRQIEDAKIADKTIVLSRDWELRVLA